MGANIGQLNRFCTSNESIRPVNFSVVVWSISHVQLFRDAMDVSLPGSSAHGISQARILEWIAISFSWDLLHPGIKPMSPVLYCQVDSLLLNHQGSPQFLSNRSNCWGNESTSS